jgi:transposase
MPWTWKTPTRVRFKTLLNEGYSQRDVARKLKIPRSSAQYWLERPDWQAKPPEAPRKISDEKVKEIIDWFTSHFDRRSYTLLEMRK